MILLGNGRHEIGLKSAETLGSAFWKQALSLQFSMDLAFQIAANIPLQGILIQ